MTRTVMSVVVASARISAQVQAALIAYARLQADSYLDLRGLHFRLADMTGATDQAVLEPAKGLTDTAALLDAQRTAAGKFVFDAVAPVDAFDRTAQFSRIFDDIQALTDTSLASVASVKVDSFVAADAYASSTTQALLDLFASQDQPAFAHASPVADSAAWTDAYAGSVTKVSVDAWASADAGQVVSQGYADPSYFASVFVGESRTF